MEFYLDHWIGDSSLYDSNEWSLCGSSQWFIPMGSYWYHYIYRIARNRLAVQKQAETYLKSGVNLVGIHSLDTLQK